MKGERKHVAIACGGTGGHLFPGIALAEELERRGIGAHLIVSPKKIDQVALAGHDSLARTVIDVMGMPSPFSPRMWTFVRKFRAARRRCLSLLDEISAGAVIGMGGFTSMPPILAARRRGLPAFIHESNAIPGKANRLTARFCDGILLGMEECAAWFPGRKTHVVGTPLRTSLTRAPSGEEARRRLGLAADRPVLLVMGGSQGARGVNQAVPAALDLVRAAGWQILHIAGSEDEATVRSAYEQARFPAVVMAFCDHMELALAAADLAVSRSGASSLTEIAYFGLPSILIPYPHAAEDHQAKNAGHFVRRQAAVMVRQSEGPDAFREALRELLESAERRREIGKNVKELSSEDSIVKICDIVASASNDE